MLNAPDGLEINIGRIPYERTILDSTRHRNHWVQGPDLCAIQLTNMTKDNNNGLIHRPTTEITKQGGGTSPVIARMSQDVLDRANARFRLGEYLLREPDYNQILLWAEAMEMSPEQVIKVLSTFGSGSGFSLGSTAIPHLLSKTVPLSVWCGVMHELPYGPDIWRDDLSIRELVLWNWNESPDLGITNLVLPRLSQLVSLECSNLYTSALDLSPVPNLTELGCVRNKLTELDLSPVPNLTRLICSKNELTELDLSPVPNLTELYCDQNFLTELDLSSAPNLIELYCDNNGLRELDLPPAPKLTHLYCMENRLTELDLFPVPNLTELRCQTNYLTELDLSPVPNLTELMCGDNQLTEVNLSPVPNLTALYCYVYHDNKLTELDLSPVPKLGYLRCNEEVEILNPRSSMTVERDREWEDGEYDHYDDYSSGLW